VFCASNHLVSNITMKELVLKNALSELDLPLVVHVSNVKKDVLNATQLMIQITSGKNVYPVELTSSLAENLVVLINVRQDGTMMNF